MRKVLILMNLAIVGVLILGFSGIDKAAAITRSMVSFTSANDQGNGMVYGDISVSTTGRYMAFVSNSTNLIPNDSNGAWRDAFVRDTQTGTTTVVSVSSSGVQTDRNIENVSISGNGRYVLMTTTAQNLVSPQVSIDASSVYIHDRKTNQTQMVAASHYVGSAYVSYRGVGLSEDGRFVYYFKNLDGGGIFVKDRLLNTEKRVDVNASNINANQQPFGSADVSCDGRFVVFASDASNLVDNDINGVSDIFLVDLIAGGAPKNITLSGNGGSGWPKITCDGNYILFSSESSNLASGDTNSYQDIFKYDVANESFAIVSRDASGNQYGDINNTSGNNPAGGYLIDQYDISMDGKYVAFVWTSYNNNNLPGFSREYARIQLRNTAASTTTTLTDNGWNYSTYPHLSYEGSKVYYIWSYASNDSFRRLYTATDYL